MTKEEKEKAITELIKLSYKYERSKNELLNIFENFLKFRLYETLLEAAPQAIFQLWLYMQYKRILMFSLLRALGTSMLSLCLTSTDVYLNFPSKV